MVGAASILVRPATELGHGHHEGTITGGRLVERREERVDALVEVGHERRMPLGLPLMGVVVAESAHVDHARRVLRGHELRGEAERVGDRRALPVVALSLRGTEVVARTGRACGVAREVGTEIGARLHGEVDRLLDLPEQRRGIR